MLLLMQNYMNCRFNLYLKHTYTDTSGVCIYISCFFFALIYMYLNILDIFGRLHSKALEVITFKV